jgi:hypothetical protein
MLTYINSETDRNLNSMANSLRESYLICKSILTDPEYKKRENDAELIQLTNCILQK